MKLKELKVQLEDLYEENKIKDLFFLLKKELSRSEANYTNFISIKRSYQVIQDRKMADIVDFETANIETNKILKRLLIFINKLSVNDLQTDGKQANTEVSHYEVSNKILVLTTEAEMAAVQDFFNSLNFTNITVKPVTAVHSMSMFDTFDLIVFDNRDLKPCFKEVHLKEMSIENRLRILDRVEKLNSVIKETTKFIIHYGEQLYWINSNRGRVQAANSKFSLYARTKEVIEFVNTYRA